MKGAYKRITIRWPIELYNLVNKAVFDGIVGSFQEVAVKGGKEYLIKKLEKEGDEND